MSENDYKIGKEVFKIVNAALVFLKDSRGSRRDSKQEVNNYRSLGVISCSSASQNGVASHQHDCCKPQAGWEIPQRLT